MDFKDIFFILAIITLVGYLIWAIQMIKGSLSNINIMKNWLKNNK